MTTLAELRQTPRPDRHFLAPDANLSSWEAIAPYFAALRSRDLADKKALEDWIRDWSELCSAVNEEMTVRYITMTCHTDDPTAESAYLDFIQNVLPKTEPENFELSRKFLAAPCRGQLDTSRYEVFTRARETEVAIFREENIPLSTQDEVLSQKYQKVCGEMTVNLDGKELTLPQTQKLYEETDRDLRRRAWLAATRRQLADRETLESVFDEMIAIRHKMAQNAGFPNFIEYQFKRLGRFDYTPADCLAFHEAVEKEVVPLSHQLREQRRRDLGVGKLAPYDLTVDPKGRPPLRPFDTADELIQGTARIFAGVDKGFHADFDILRTNNLLDLDSRKGKAPGGYQSSLEELRLPFIFMNAAGRNTDVFTLLHEGGHAFHSLATRDEPILMYRSAPIEFCEVASMGMEMMACERLDSFYSAENARRARRSHLEETIEILPWIARVDAMQHWMYTNPTHTRAEREQAWLALDKRFGSDLDWSELPEWQACSWYAKLHFFCVPLYYVEYGIAQLGALQLWNRFLENPRAAVQGYREALSLGGSRPLPELFAAAGLRFAFDAATIGPLMRRLEADLKAA